jgi:diguanylate cyclase (GGDEF)-like protein/PAS domain S-box-containing protein
MKSLIKPISCPKRLTPTGIALLYAGFSALWIIASDYLLTFIVDDPILQNRIELTQSLIFVFVTSGLLYLLLKGWRESLDGSVDFFIATVQDITERQLNKEALHEKEFLLTESQRIAHVGSWKIDISTGNIVWSEETYRIYGVAPETFRHSMESFYTLIHADDRGIMQAWVEACLAGERPGELEFRTVHPDGKVRFLSSRGDMHYDAQNRPTQLVGTVQDITERKAAKAKIQQLSQIYAALSQCNQAIVRCTSEAELLPQICRDAVNFGGFKMAWIGFADPPTQMVKPIASFGEGAADYLHNIEISAAADSPFGHGPTGTAIRENQPIWCQDFQNAPVTAPWHERCKRFGWGASASLPNHRNAVAIGAFNLYAGEINAFDEAARNLLVEMAMDISFALDNFDREARRKQAEEALCKNERRLRTIIETEPECVKIVDCNGQLLEMNAAGLAMLEADSVGEAQQYPLINFVLPEYRAAFAALHKRVMSGESGIVEFEITGLKGARRWLETHAAPLRDETGEVTLLLGITRDITARKRADAQLKLAAKVFNQSNEGFMITDAKHNIILVNHAFTVISGYSEAEVLGQNVRLLSSGHHDRDFYRSILDSIDSEGHWQGEIWNRRKNSEVYPELLNLSVARDSAGQITEYIGVFADITQLKASQAQLEFLAYHDSLTGLPNRLQLFSSLQHSIDMAEREGKQVALLMLDLDRFKDVNDSFGHLAGDQLLQLVAKRLTKRVRIVDTVARLGGDEFTVLLENIAHLEDAARVAEAIIADLRKPLKLPKIGEIMIGVSIGISLYPQYGDTPEILLQQADTALYQAKEKGRNRYAYFSDELTSAARERIELETRLRRAIAQNELRVYYQPQVDIASGRIVGAEALVRWQDPKEGLIAPIRFIPVAEQTGLIMALGEWVLRETCRQGRQWIEAGLPPLTLAVNVSPYQFRHGEISALVAAVLNETGFPADRLELELTESGLMEYQDQAVERLNNLRSQGIRLAIDDFGTGYSSLAYLKRFPLDVLKIDKSFIDDIPHHQDDMEIAATIVAIGHTLGFKVLAEGVETPEQLAFLQAQGCDLYQGYLKSRPLPAEDFVALLREG